MGKQGTLLGRCRAMRTRSGSARQSVHRRTRRERGRISAGVPIMSVAALICVGIAVDLSGHTLAEQELRDFATSCAQLGVQDVGMGGGAGLEAVSATRECLEQYGLTATVTVVDDTVHAQISGVYHTRVLTIIGVNDIPTQGSGAVTAQSR